MNTLYSQIEHAIRNHIPSTKVSENTSKKDVSMVVRKVMRDHPDIFWFSHQWKYDNTSNIIDFHYTIGKERTKAAKFQIEDVVKNDFRIDEVRKLSQPEQVMYIYKWIALYCKYNVYSAYNQSIYSVFVYRNSVCTGFAKAAQFLCKQFNIESKLVFGKLKNSDRESRHCWLIVKINGIWYHLDPTFAERSTSEILKRAGVDPVWGNDELMYNYFCVDTQTIKDSKESSLRSKDFIEDESSLPACTAKLDYSKLQELPIKKHRDINPKQCGCPGVIMSKSGRTSDIYIWQDTSNKQKIVKFFRNNVAQQQIENEMKFMTELSDSHHVIHVQGITEDKKGIIMEQAIPLADLLCSHYYELSGHNFCKLIIDVIDALQDCLNHGIYYRDIHLNNIFRNEKGKYVLGDFGSCSWISSNFPDKNMAIGSPWYMAPETCLNKDFDEKSATYGVGMIAYFILNNLNQPFYDSTKEESLQLRLKGYPIPTPSRLLHSTSYFEQKLGKIIINALSYDITFRYQTLKELRSEFYELSCDYSSKHISIYKNDFTEDTFQRNSTQSKIDEYARTFGYFNDELNLFTNKSGQKNANLSQEENRKLIIHKDILESSQHTLPKSQDNPDDSKQQIDDFATSMSIETNSEKIVKYEHSTIYHEPVTKSPSFWSKLFGKKGKSQMVYSSVFAPSEVTRKQHMMVQVYLHLAEETETVKSLAVEADRNTERRGYEPLAVKMKEGDNVEIELNIHGNSLLYTSRKSINWQGSFVKRAFYYTVPENIDVLELSGSVNIYVNGAIAGEMLFLTNIVNTNPVPYNPPITVKSTRKLFISYSHKDILTAEKIAKIHEALGIDVFFDKHRLKAGYIYSEEISKYIQTADTFVLCWSKNAAESDYVKKERQEALARAYPQCKPKEKAKLKIQPYSIEPHANPPADMIEHYHFEEL